MTKKAKSKESSKINISKPKSVVGPIVWLSVLFFFGQMAYQLYQHIPMLSHASVSDFFMNQVITSGRLDVGILYYILVQIAIVILYIIFVLMVTRCVGLMFKWSKSQMRNWGIFFWFALTLALWLANEYFYPFSDFALLSMVMTKLKITLTAQQLQFTSYGVMGITGLILLFALFGLLIWFSKNIFKTFMIIVLIGGAGFTYYQYVFLPDSMRTAAKHTQPNIILIGLDSLRPDMTNFFNKNNTLTPNIDEFLKKSTVFTRNATPSLQTFPVWASIISGKYPNNNGIVNNYMAVPKKVIDNNLVKLVQNKGYHAIFVSDNSRINKMSLFKSFDHINSPPENFNNMLLGEGNDLVLNNMLTNTPVGPYLFPQTYGNRAISEAYDPGTLAQRLRHALDEKQNKSLFISINMTMARWPYGWNKSESASEVNSGEKNLNLYSAAVGALDWQFAEIVGTLRQMGILENSIVIVFSDKGEMFSLEKDKLIRENNYTGSQNVSSILKDLKKHNVFSSTFHSLLAMQVNSTTQTNRTKPVQSPTSLVDIYPTIAEFVGAETQSNDADSLLGIVLGKTESLPNKTIPFETGFNYYKMTMDNPNLQQFLKNGLPYLSIGCRTGIITLNNSAIQKVEKSKAHGTIEYPNIRFQLPPKLGGNQRIIYNIENRSWTTE